MDTKYAVIWFEGPDSYTLVDRSGKYVLMSENQASKAPSISAILRTEAEVEDATEDVKYAISVELLENLFGCVVNDD